MKKMQATKTYGEHFCSGCNLGEKSVKEAGRYEKHKLNQLRYSEKNPVKRRHSLIETSRSSTFTHRQQILVRTNSISQISSAQHSDTIDSKPDESEQIKNTPLHRNQRCFGNRMSKAKLWFSKKRQYSLPTEQERRRSNPPKHKNAMFEEFLQSPDSSVAFRQFLRKEHSEENLDFLINVQKYKKKASKKRALAIYSTFIKDEAEKEINVTGETKKNILKKLQCPDKEMFDEASDSVIQLLRTDSYERFVKHKTGPSDNIHY